MTAEYSEHEKRCKDCKLYPDEFSLELLTDIDMLLIFEKGIRGGITQAVKRYTKANNKYMKDLYNPDKKGAYFQYLDTNNLDGWAMIQKLPRHGFSWEKVEDFTPGKIDKLVKKYKKGYILQVDVEYSKELHKNHNELPFLADRLKIGKVEKLVPNPKDKKTYVVRIKSLNQALKHGLILKKVHRVIRFEQSNWTKPYIMLNTRLRTAAKNEFEKDVFKLMNNSVFRKAMENIRNHKDMKLVTSLEKYAKYVMKPNFKDGHPFSKETLMYEFHYEYMRPKYGSKVKLCNMDTDSFVHETETENLYRDIAEDVETRFDTRGYSRDENRPLPIGKNKKVISMLKDELGGKVMTEFVALRAKCIRIEK